MATEYFDIVDFIADLELVKQHITKARKIVDSPKWTNWMKETNENFDVDVIYISNRLSTAIGGANVAIGRLEDELHKAR